MNEQNKKRKEMALATGGVSILAVFVVLCLTTLSVLSLVSAQADLALSTRGAKATEEYYAADLIAQEKLKSMAESLLEEDWEESVRALGGEIVMEGDAGPVLSYRVEIDRIKALEVRVRISANGEGTPTGEWEVIAYKTVTAPSVESEGGMNVLQR